MSRRHARLLRQQRHVLIEDLGSYNGIRVNGDRIAGPGADRRRRPDPDRRLRSRHPEPRSARPRHPRSRLAQSSAPATADSAERDDSAATVRALPASSTPRSPTSPRRSTRRRFVRGAAHAGARATDGRRQRSKGGATALVRAGEVGPEATREVLEFDAAEAPRLVVLNTEFAGREFRLHPHRDHHRAHRRQRHRRRPPLAVAQPLQARPRRSTASGASSTWSRPTA